MQAQSHKPRRVSVKKSPGVFKSSSGKYEIAYRDSDGRLRFETIGANLEEAKTAREEKRTRIRRGERVAPTKQMFGDLAGQWIAARKLDGLRPRTIEFYEWILDKHLLPYFETMPLARITAQEVDRFKQAKADEGLLAANQINKVLTGLASVLDLAVDYGYMIGNPARGRRRRLKGTTPIRTYVEPEQLPTLLEAAEGLYDGKGRPLIATLAGAGLRIGEALAMRREDVNTGKGVLRVITSKTEAGVRDVDLSAALREELALYLDASPWQQPDDLVFPTRTGQSDNRNNVRRRLIVKAVEAANVKLGELGIAPIGRLSPHGLRHTYASLRCVCNDPLPYTTEQIGHSDGRFTLKVYAHAFKHRERLSATELEQYEQAIEWAGLGSSGNGMSTGARNPLQAEGAEMATFSA